MISLHASGSADVVTTVANMDLKWILTQRNFAKLQISVCHGCWQHCGHPSETDADNIVDICWKLVTAEVRNPASNEYGNLSDTDSATLRKLVWDGFLHFQKSF